MLTLTTAFGAGLLSSPAFGGVHSHVLQQFVPRGTRAYVFDQIYTVFLVLGTLVGIVVIAYMLQKAYKYRASAHTEADDDDRPSLGEIPTGGGGGRKLFVSFAFSAIIVISLISWTYLTLLYVDNPDPQGAEDAVEVEVVGHQFYWEFVYANGHSESGTLRVPEDTRVELRVTSADVFHNFGVPELRAKADAIPGQTTSTWFVGDETGTYRAVCYELCGSGHSYMNAEVQVMEEDAYRSWYANTSGENSSANVRAGAAVTTG
jgi:cytochrome c oxidase subunit 2